MSLERPISRELEAKIDRELEAGERVVWKGKPIPRFFTPSSTGAFLFALPWTAFAIVWMLGAAEFKMPDFNEGKDLFPLFGVPFLLIGLGMLSSPFWAYWRSLKTVYVITEKRALTFDGGVFTTTIRSYAPHKLQDLFRREKSNGTGDVLIDRRDWRDTDGDQQTEELGFLRLENPKEIEALLKELAKRVG